MQTDVKAQSKLHLKNKTNLKVHTLFCNYCHGRNTSVLENSPRLRPFFMYLLTVGCQSRSEEYLYLFIDTKEHRINSFSI